MKLVMTALGAFVPTEPTQLKSQSHITTEGQSASQSVGRSVKLLLVFGSTLISSSAFSRAMNKNFILSQTCTCSEMGPLFDEGGVCLPTWALGFLFRSYSTNISAVSRRPGRYGLCAPFVTALY
jgi:hypothetical protein